MNIYHSAAIFGLFPTLLPCAALAADDAAEKVIVITANGVERPASESGQAISVIDADRLAALQAATIADALRTLPGLAIAQRGPVGSQTSVFIRGANSAQTLVLVDGVPVNDVSSPNGAFDFGALPTGNFERIELLRGANSVIWGSQAIGGVIALTSTRPSETLALRGLAEAGRAGTFRTNASVSGTTGAISGSLGGGWYHSRGISALAGGTERDGFENASANGRLDVALGAETALELSGWYNRGRIEYDAPFGLGANALPVSRNRQFVGQASLRFGLADGRFVNRISYSRTAIDRRGSDPVRFSFNNFDISGDIDRFRWQGELSFAEWGALTTGLEHERVRTRTSFEGAKADLARNQQSGGFAQLVLSPVTGLNLTAGVRHVDYSDYGGETTLAANASWSPNGGATRLRASYAEGFRAPTLSEGQPPFGNPALRPESARNIDLGLDHSLLDGRATLSATWFQRTSDDLIAFSFATFRSENIDRARARGWEVEFALRPVETLDIRANFSRVDARNRTAGTLFNKHLALRPRDSLTLTADWQSPWRVKLGGSIQVVGDSFDDAANRVRLDGYALASLRATIALTDEVEAFARIENLFDARYQSVAGYNSYGRGGFAGIRLTL